MMSVDAILEELPKLSEAELLRVRDVLNSILDQRNVEHMTEMAHKIDDKDPSHWLTLEEFDRRLELRDNERPE